MTKEIWRRELDNLDCLISDKSLNEFLSKNYDIQNIKKTIQEAYDNITDPMCILHFISVQIENENTDVEIHTEHCTICGDKLTSRIYGNVCGIHIPSYALW